MHSRCRRTITAVLLLLLACYPGLAHAFEQHIREAMHLMHAGQPDEALALLKDAQVDYPNASELRFGIAYATFMKAEFLLEAGAQEEGIATLSEAQFLFSSLTQDETRLIAREATFNNATAIAREALLISTSEDYAAGIAALRRAVSVFETALSNYPGHEGLRQNLEHTRYKLKELLQNPPPEQEQPQDQPPQEPPPSVMSRFGHAATDLPGARTQVEENTAILVPPGEQEAQQ